MKEFLKNNVAVIFVFCLCSCLATKEVLINPDDLVISKTLERIGRSGSVVNGEAGSVGKTDGSPMSFAVADGREVNLAVDVTSPKVQHIIIASVLGGVAIIGIIIAVTCYCKFRSSESKNFASQRHDNGYATYGVTGPVAKNSLHFHEPGDRKLAQSAQMYHYQYQKQQMIDMEKANGEVKADATDEENEAEDEDDVVYQTCGLASSADLQIPNPMFKGDDGKGSDEGKDDIPTSNGSTDR